MSVEQFIHYTGRELNNSIRLVIMNQYSPSIIETSSIASISLVPSSSVITVPSSCPAPVLSTGVLVALIVIGWSNVIRISDWQCITDCCCATEKTKHF